jgi:hypothetical protein
LSGSGFNDSKVQRSRIHGSQASGHWPLAAGGVLLVIGRQPKRRMLQPLNP